MSDLPVIDPLKVANRRVTNLSQQLAEAFSREAQLEILAEALRDERDALYQELQRLQETK